METIRDILASHGSGISRDGLLAWARLRVDPHLTEAQFDAAIAELGDEVVDVQGFLYLREHAPAGYAEPDAATATPQTAVAPAIDPGLGGPAAELPGSPPAAAWPSPPSPPPPGGPAWTPPIGEPGAAGSWPAPQAASGRRTMVAAAIGVAVFLGVAGLGAVALRQGEAASTPAVPTPTAGTVVDAGAIAVGDCLILPSEDQFDEVRTLDCTEAHDGEVFLLVDHPDGDYPSDAEFEGFVDAQCRPAFASYTASELADQDVLTYGWFTPTESAWERGDREVACYLTPADGSRTSQSYRGANP